MKRKFTVLACLRSATCALRPCPAAQQPNKVPRIAFLSTSDTGADNARFDGIRQRLRELGYIDGQNIVIEYRSGGRDLDRYQKIVAELARLKFDIIVVGGGTTYVQVVKKATKTIPIVMTGPGGDPVKAGLIESLARPGGNVTGVTLLARRPWRQTAGVTQRSRSQSIPSRDSLRSCQSGPPIRDERGSASRGTRVKVDASALGGQRLRMVSRKFWRAVARQRPDGLYALGGPLMIANRQRIADFALKNRLPSIDGDKAAVGAGGLMSYGADAADSYRRVAYFVDRILKGAKPADLPVEQPTKFEFVINLKTAEQIGVTIPPDLLARATKIIR